MFKKEKKTLFTKKRIDNYLFIAIIMVILAVAISILNATIMHSFGTFDILILVLISIFFFIMILFPIGCQIIFLIGIKDYKMFKYFIFPVILTYIFSIILLYPSRIDIQNESNWFYEYILAVLFINMIVTGGFHKISETLHDIYSKNIPKNIKKKNRQLLLLKWSISIGIAVFYSLYILLIIFPDLNTNGLNSKESSYLFSHIVLLLYLVGMSKLYNTYIIETVEDEHWKKILRIALIPIISFGIYEVLKLYFGNPNLIFSNMTRLHSNVFAYGFIFVNAMGLFYVYHLVKIGLSSFVKWLYKKVYKNQR